MKSNKTRRDFLKGVAVNAMGVALCRGEEPPAEGGRTAEVRDLLVANGYNPSGGNSALLAVIADAHIFLGTDYPQYRTETYDDALIAEINSLNSLVTEFVLAGDLVSYHSMSPGIPPYQLHRGWAIEEYQIAKVQVQRFNYRRWLIPGNHDTTAYEANADLFCEHMQVPAYQKSVFGGVPVFFLNSGNAGMLDPVQHAWFAEEASLISKDQEVLIVVHYPPFFSVWFQAGVKRILTEVFKNHRATVWAISGHNHSFAEQKFVHGGVTFVQTQVTCASALAQSFGDKRNPGYTLLALQDGRMVCRLFRSLKDTGFQLRPTLGQMTGSPVVFPFDTIEYALVKYEEGFYDRTNRVVEFRGVDVGCYITFCKKLVFRVDPSDYMGRMTHFALAGVIGLATLPSCGFSFTRADGTWVSAVFPAAIGGGLYTVPIPEEFQNNGTFFIKLENTLTGSSEGFAMSGWALSTNAANLTEYEKWTHRTYGNLQKTEQTHPNAITPGSGYSNLMNFAFNLIPRQGETISGSPKMSVSTDENDEEFVHMVFARMAMNLDSGISYEIERSIDLGVWEKVPAADYEEMLLRTAGTWIEVEYKIPSGLQSNTYFRIRLEYAGSWPE